MENEILEMAWKDLGKYQLDVKGKGNGNREFRIEHFIPRKYIMDALLELGNPVDREKIVEIIDKKLLTRIITADEDNNINKQGYVYKNRSTREEAEEAYKKAGIRIKYPW